MNRVEDAPTTANDTAASAGNNADLQPIADTQPIAVGDGPVPTSRAQLVWPVASPSPSRFQPEVSALVPGSLRRVAGSAGMWKKQLGAAKEHWPRMSINDLIWSDGHVQRLAGLVQELYQVDHDEAEQQVRRFLAQSAC